MLRDRWLFGRKAGSFTLQWHLTNACELHCAHCYDRSKRTVLDLDEASRVLDDFTGFCDRRRVSGQVCLTGGNPFLYPGFMDLYRVVALAGHAISILGNPVSREQIAGIASIRRPIYYQVSLEGLPEHNDRIRGAGNFKRVLGFLGVLRAFRIRAHVMLTLTRDNPDQVIPLGERLRGLADRFTFNRLSQVGEGALLDLPERDEYIRFMKEYIAAARSNPVLGFKDNLFNIFRHHYGRPLLRGCTGFGCGAAFNFVALLPDGEVHACRKFPSPIGSVRESNLPEIYDSAEAKRYRRGCGECRGCPVRNVCGGCLAVSHGRGLDVFRRRDPQCFMADRAESLAGFQAGRLSRLQGADKSRELSGAGESHAA
ncbi:MAG: selenobiotic family peptide radical SAM maturase [Nitrospirae bacterium RBG_16_64_22]|nr:MAG: selenobiotic family peptide radical SAM maturase [Nitrospirae bacterium RBG_16_64_22]